MSKAGAIPAQCVSEVMERASWASADKQVATFKTDYEKYLIETPRECKTAQKEAGTISPIKTAR